jgi:hypothetical protein
LRTLLANAVIVEFLLPMVASGEPLLSEGIAA